MFILQDFRCFIQCFLFVYQSCVLQMIESAVRVAARSILHRVSTRINYSYFSKNNINNNFLFILIQLGPVLNTRTPLITTCMHRDSRASLYCYCLDWSEVSEPFKIRTEVYHLKSKHVRHSHLSFLVSGHSGRSRRHDKRRSKRVTTHYRKVHRKCSILSHRKLSFENYSGTPEQVSWPQISTRIDCLA